MHNDPFFGRLRLSELQVVMGDMCIEDVVNRLREQSAQDE